VVPPDCALLPGGELAVVSPVRVDALAGALALELLWVVPDPPPPHPASASAGPRIAALAAAQIACRVADAIVGVSLMMPPSLR